MSDIHSERFIEMLEPGGDQPPRPGQVKPGMTIAKELGEKIRAWTDNSMFCEQNGQPMLSEPTAEQIESLINKKLGPIGGQLSNVRHDLAAILAGLRNADVDVKEMEGRTRESLGRVRFVLSILEAS